MKTTILISEALDTPTQIAEAKLPSLAVRMLVEAYSKNRREAALLLVDRGVDGQPVYVTVGSHPPELYIGDRVMWGVCVPIDSQDPVAVFVDRGAAVAWGDAQSEPYRLTEINADDADTPQVAVALILNRDGKTLLGKLPSGVWTLPEGLLGFGEAVDKAAQRILLRTAGLVATSVALSRTAPFVNTYYADLRRHYVTLVALIEANGDPMIVDPGWIEWAWFDTRVAPPSRLLPTVKQIMTVAAASAASTAGAALSSLTEIPSLTEASPPSPDKPQPPRRSKSR